MIPELRRDFNSRFRAGKYADFLSLLDRRCGTHVGFRVSETPCFFPAPLIRRIARAGAELVHQLTDNQAYLEEARRQIPPQFLTPGETRRPLFLQADFGLIRDNGGGIAPRLVEIQAFPSLYAYQPVLDRAYCDAYDLEPRPSDERSETMVKRAILGDRDPENVVLLEIDPANQKTLPDFLLTEKLCGIRTVDIRDVRRRGDKLFYGKVPIERIYNRVIADEFVRKNVQAQFRFADELDVEWAGHPNWFFLISKFSIPWLKHETVPEARFLDRIDTLPDDLENYVLKPLYSFAGLGVKVGPNRDDIESIARPERGQYLLQQRMRFEPVIETPFGPTQAEIRVMYIWLESLEPVNVIVRMGRGKMMGVDHNRDMQWVGASSGFII
jgi:hypothetical protein